MKFHSTISQIYKEYILEGLDVDRFYQYIPLLLRVVYSTDAIKFKAEIKLLLETSRRIERERE